MPKLPREVHVSRSAYAVATIAAVLALSGCWVSYAGRPDLSVDLRKSPGYIPDAMLQSIQADGLTIDQVKAFLGEPTVVGATNRKSAIGYLHCVSWSGQCQTTTIIVPGKVKPCFDEQCQVVGVWFDETGHADKTYSIDYWTPELCQVREWLNGGGGGNGPWVYPIGSCQGRW